MGKLARAPRPAFTWQFWLALVVSVVWCVVFVVGLEVVTTQCPLHDPCVLAVHIHGRAR